MKRAIIFLVILMLAACTAPSQAPPAEEQHAPMEESTPPAEQVEAAEPAAEVPPAEQETMATPEANTTEVSAAEPTNETAPQESQQIQPQLSVAEQAKFFPDVDAAVKNSSCYMLSWKNMENYTAQTPLTIDKAIRYQYVSGLKWKAWITYQLFHSRKLMDTQSVALVIDNGQVSCSQSAPFAIDWVDALERVKTR